MKPFFKTLLFTILVPGTVAGWVPWLLRGSSSQATENLALRWTGILLIAIGVAVYLHTAFWGFANRGQGTPAPIAPPKKLVVEGLHRYVRNPMYIGVLSIVIGQALLFESGPIVRYAAMLWVGFHLFVLFYEEPILKRQFATEYDEYRKRVPRWLPRVHANW